MKRCFKCGTEKDISEFYQHPMMADGHLGKCKSCTKQDVRAHYVNKICDPNWLARERERWRNKIARARKLYGYKIYESETARQNWRKANIEKIRAQHKARYAMLNGVIKKSKACDHCGRITKLYMHHPNYAYPLVVESLCAACHGIEHRKKFGEPIAVRTAR